MTGFAANDAADVALMGEAVDGIVEDWLWVSRLRGEGVPLTFIPYSSSVGALMVPADGSIDSLADLDGKRLGIAGGPLDKSWLLIQALAKEQGVDLAEVTELVYGAPPLLAEKFKSGELDAVINYWHFAARLEAEGHRRLIDVTQAQEALGVPADTPQLGYVFREEWADEHPDLVQAFARASRAAKVIMDESDEEWERLRPLTRAEDDATLDALKRRYREGIVHSWGDAGAPGRRDSSMRCWPSSVASSWSAARRCWSMAHSGPVSATRTARKAPGRQPAPRAGRPPAAAGNRWSRILLPALSILLLLAVWQIAASQAANPRLMPAPLTVFAVLVDEIVDGELLYHLAVTLLRVAASFALAMSIGIAIGFVMGRSQLIDRLGNPWLLFFLNLPALVTIILAYIWIGLVEAAAILAVALNKIPNVAVTIREGARALDTGLMEMAQVFRVPRLRTLREVVLPQLYPYLAAAARSGLALIWKIVLVVELLGRSNGVGFQLGLYFQLFDVAGILAYALAFIAVVQLIEWGILQPLEHRLSQWRR